MIETIRDVFFVIFVFTLLGVFSYLIVTLPDTTQNNYPKKTISCQAGEVLYRDSHRKYFCVVRGSDPIETIIEAN